LEWADRFQPQLLQAAAEMPAAASDLDVFLAATRWTSHRYLGPSGYAPTYTLRESLEQDKLDCVRATDMIGAIYRNAGRARFGNVRWCGETEGHSVAAYLGTQDGKMRPMVVDGLNPSPQPEVFPDCYFHGHAWPANFANAKP